MFKNKLTFLDLYFNNTISNKIFKKDFFDVKYKITSLFSTYENTIHIEIYDNKQIQIEYDLIFYNYKKLLMIQIQNIIVNNNYKTNYSIDMLKYNLQNKDKIHMLWITIKYFFIESKWLLILLQILQLSYDLPDEINKKKNLQWLINNGY